MKRGNITLALAMLALGLTSAPSSPAGGAGRLTGRETKLAREVRGRYDRFEDKSYAFTGPQTVWIGSLVDELQVRALVECPGDSLCSPDSLILAFTMSSKRIQFVGSPPCELVVFTPKAKFQAAMQAYSARGDRRPLMGGYQYETLRTVVGRDEGMAVLEAMTEGRICDRVFEVSYQARAVFRHFGNYVRGLVNNGHNAAADSTGP